MLRLEERSASERQSMPIGAFDVELFAVDSVLCTDASDPCSGESMARDCAALWH